MPIHLAHPAPEEFVYFISDAILRDDSVPPQLSHLVCTSGAAALKLDLAAVDAPTAAGLGKLVALYRALREAGVRLVLLNVRPEVYGVLRATALTRLFAVQLKEAA